MQLLKSKHNTIAASKGAKPIFQLRIPENLEQDLIEYLGEEKRGKLHLYAYLCHAILTSHLDKKQKEAGEFVPLYSRILYGMLTRNETKGVIDDMVRWGIIEVDNSYRKGTAGRQGESKGYRFCSKYRHTTPKHLHFNNRPMYKKLMKQNEVKQHLQQILLATDPKHAFLARQLKRISFDLDSCYRQELSGRTDWDTVVSASQQVSRTFSLSINHSASPSLTSNPTYSNSPLPSRIHPPYVYCFKNYKRLYGAEKLYRASRGEIPWDFKLDPKTGRLFTNLTNLKKDFRCHLSLDTQERLVIVDVGECQPFLFSIILMRRGREIWGQDLPEDVQHFIRLTSKSGFYRFFMQACGVPESDRSIFKKIFFGKIFYCQKRTTLDPKNLVGAAFRHHFPNVYRVLMECKGTGRDSYKKLPVELMRLESKIILGDVCSRIASYLDESFFVATIHDGIVTTEGRAEEVKRLIERAFIRETGHAPTVKVEAFNYT